MVAVDQKISADYLRLKASNLPRDKRYNDITAVRVGDMGSLYPDAFSPEWPRPIAANLINVAATDAAETIAPLPNLACSAGTMRTDVDKKRADKKNKIGRHYWETSQLDRRMFSGADWFGTYGALVFEVEPDFERQTPIIKPVNPVGCYWRLSWWGEVLSFFQCWTESSSTLKLQFPEAAQVIMGGNGRFVREPVADAPIEVVRYVSETEDVLFLPGRQWEVIHRITNFGGCCPIVVAELPSVDAETRGKFDQVIVVQLALAKMKQLMMDAAEQAVHAPLVLPHDVNQLPVGPGAVIRTDGHVGRVPLPIDSSVWAEARQLDEDVKVGARYPEGRLGQVQASVVTGRGIEALLGTFDTQIKTAQTIIGNALERVTSKAYEMDVALWPNVRKEISGVAAGKSFRFSYTPSSDIGTDYSCRVTYGSASGLKPNAALVALLQLRGDGLVSRDTVRRQLWFDVDLDEEQRALDVDETRDALKQGFFAFLQALAPMIQAGVDPQHVMRAAATVVTDLRKGRPIEEAMFEAFQPPPKQPETPGQEADPNAPPSPDGGQPAAGPDGQPILPGVRDSGLLQGVAHGQAGLPPGGMPDILSLVSGMRNGRAVSDASVTRRVPI